MFASNVFTEAPKVAGIDAAVGSGDVTGINGFIFQVSTYERDSQIDTVQDIKLGVIRPNEK